MKFEKLINGGGGGVGGGVKISCTGWGGGSSKITKSKCPLYILNLRVIISVLSQNRFYEKATMVGI